MVSTLKPSVAIKRMEILVREEKDQLSGISSCYLNFILLEQAMIQIVNSRKANLFTIPSSKPR